MSLAATTAIVCLTKILWVPCLCWTLVAQKVCVSGYANTRYFHSPCLEFRLLGYLKCQAYHVIAASVLFDTDHAFRTLHIRKEEGISALELNNRKTFRSNGKHYMCKNAQTQTKQVCLKLVSFGHKFNTVPDLCF